MKVILLEKVHNLGQLGDTVNVKAGYGRNFLIPYGKAVPATEENIKKFESRRAELEKHAADQLAEAQKRAATLEGLTLTLTSKAMEEGKLFGSIGIREIVEALEKEGKAIERREVNMPAGPIREIGEHEVELRLHSDVIVKIKVKVEPEKESA